MIVLLFLQQLILGSSTIFHTVVAYSRYPENVPQVVLPHGRVFGQEFKTPENKTFYGFRGIPYADVPLGNKRFQAPQPPQNWSYIISNANNNPPDCISKRPQSADNQSEDCLFINVYTPRLAKHTDKETELLPVMFWISGKDFQSGTSSYDVFGPDYLVQEDVVFISFNYRMGTFGFLSTGDNAVPGNAGLKDQNQALNWTHQNIHLFGGDPKKVTIFGHGAGAASVVYHILSKKSTGLFRAAIAQSGTALCPWSFNPEPEKFAEDLFYYVLNLQHRVLFDYVTTGEMYAYLSTQNSDMLAVSDVGLKTNYPPLPSLEPNHEGAFLTEPSFESLDDGKFSKVPLMMGLTSEEYLGLIKPFDQLRTLAAEFDENIKNLIPINLILANSTNKTEVAVAIKNIYLNNSQLFSQNLGAALQYRTDNEMARPIVKHAEIQSKFTDVYFYQFSYHGALGRTQNFNVNGSMGSVGNGQELPYLFRMNLKDVNTTDMSKFPKEDVLVHRQMIKLWTNFAKFLKPTPEYSDLLQNITWPTIYDRSFRYLDIGKKLQILNGYPRENSYLQWNKIFTTYGIPPFSTF